MDIFEALASEELETIAQLLRERRLAESEVLCRQGDPGDALFIVTGGRIRLSTTDPSGNEKILTYFTDGQFFGEMSLLTGSPRSATASAETDSQVLVLDKHSFDQLLASHEEFQKLAQEHTQYAQRLDSLTQKRYLTEDEKLEEVRLKKLKLRLKDQMESIERQYRQHQVA